MQTSKGIVLHKKGTRISLIDESKGTIVAHTFSFVTVGGLYSYTIKNNNNFFPIISEEKIFLLPLDIARENILFFHHLLEITLYCAPVGSCIKNIFPFFLWIYTNKIAWNSKNGKLYTLFRLLLYLDIGPNETIPKRLLYIAEIPIDRISEEILQLIPQGTLHIWIKKSFLYHTLYKNFKTKIMLEEIGLHV